MHPSSSVQNLPLGSAKAFQVLLTILEQQPQNMECATVDGRNPGPVDVVIIPLFAGIIHPRWCRISSINSMKCTNTKSCIEREQQITGGPIYR